MRAPRLCLSVFVFIIGLVFTASAQDRPSLNATPDFPSLKQMVETPNDRALAARHPSPTPSVVMMPPVFATLTDPEKIILNLAAVVCVLAFFLGKRMGAQERQERRMDESPLLASQGISPEGISEEVQRLARCGRKIAAIKLHRQQTHRSLADAKRDIEAFMTGRP
jgi:ribosomal protein L7/L12